METVWSCIPSWIHDGKNRKNVVKNFNDAAKDAYIKGGVPCLLKCCFSRGNKTYKHSTSSWFYSGIRILAMVNDNLSDEELNRIGLSFLSNKEIVRMLITLGWDTLEVINYTGDVGFQWKLTNYSK